MTIILPFMRLQHLVFIALNIGMYLIKEIIENLLKSEYDFFLNLTYTLSLSLTLSLLSFFQI